MNRVSTLLAPVLRIIERYYIAATDRLWSTALRRLLINLCRQSLKDHDQSGSSEKEQRPCDAVPTKES